MPATVASSSQQQRGAVRAAALGSLLRLAPFVRPVAGRLVAGLVVALTAAMVSLVVPQVIRAIVDGPLVSGQRVMVLWGALALLALGVGEAGLWYLRRVLVLTPTVGVELRLRDTLYQHLQDLPVAFHDGWDSGQLLSRSSTDLSRVRRWLTFGAIMLVVNVLTVLVGSVVLVWMSPLLGCVFLVFAVPMAVLTWRAQRRYRVLTRRSQDQAGALATDVEESVQGIRVIKAFGRQHQFLEQFAARAEQLRGTELSKARVNADVRMWLILLPQVAIASCMALGVFFAGRGTLTVGELSAFVVTATLLVWPVRSLGLLLADTFDAAAAVQRVFEALDARNTVLDPDAPLEPPPGPGTLEFQDVRFRFADAGPSEPDTLRGVSLSLRAGETVALVGETGSGKSLMTELAIRLRDPTAGRVLVDGVDVRLMRRRDVRSRVAVAFEAPLLFSANVRENVLLGRADATDEDLRRALTIAQAGFVDSLPDGIDTVIGEEGHSLSGGQRQRLSLARAIAAGAEVLVLDDPLSAVDVSTEAAATAALREALAGVTTLVVAHRPSTVALADRVAVLRGGRIAALGKHRELLRSDAYYRELISATDEMSERQPLSAGPGGQP